MAAAYEVNESAADASAQCGESNIEYQIYQKMKKSVQILAILESS